MTLPSRRKHPTTPPNTNLAKAPSRHWLCAAHAAVVLFAVANVASASEATGARGSKLQWRPVRPSQQVTIDADEREARADRARIINEAKNSRPDRVTLRSRDRQIDFHVRPVANVQPSRSGADAAQRDADAAADAFGAPSTQTLPRTPFGNVATRQPDEPTPMTDETPSVAQPRDAETPAFPGDDPLNRAEPREPGRLDPPDTRRLPPGVTDDPTPGSPLELMPPDESRAPDPKQDCDTAVERVPRRPAQCDPRPRDPRHPPEQRWPGPIRMHARANFGSPSIQVAIGPAPRTPGRPPRCAINRSISSSRIWSATATPGDRCLIR